MTNEKYSLEVLEKIKEVFASTSGIGEFVVSDLESYGDDWHSHLQDIIKHGCVSGTVSSLIYYSDTEKFHDEYENEIDEMISEYVEGNGISFSEMACKIDVWDIGQLKNWKAWFAYEEYAHGIENYLESEY